MADYVFFPKGGFANQLIQYCAVLNLLNEGDTCSVYLDSFALDYGPLVSQRSSSNLLIQWFFSSCKHLNVIFKKYDPVFFSRLRYRFFRHSLLPNLFLKPYILCDDFYQDSFNLLNSSSLYKSFFEYSLKFFPTIPLALDSISVHIRLGDYRALDSCLPPDYYTEAISYFLNLFQPSSIYIFSDEPFRASDICNVPSDIPCITLSNGDPFFDFLSLYLSSNLIISASTFSWLPAFSSCYVNSVIAPISSWLPTRSNFITLPY